MPSGTGKILGANWSQRICTAVMAAILATASVSRADDPAEPLASDSLSERDLHVWGRFSPGTWKQVRMVTETLNSRGDVVNTTTTDTKTTLLQVSPKSLSLQVDVAIHRDGQPLARQSRVFEHGFFCETPSEPDDVKLLGASHLTIEGERVHCQVRQVTARSGDVRKVTRLYLSESIEPFVLKRETARVSADGQVADDFEITTEVVALDMPYRVKGQIKSAAFERTIQRTPQGANVTLDWTCVDVPGGIVARASKELDAQGRLLRRGTQELVDYHIVLEQPATDASGPRYLTRRQARKAARRGR